MKKLIYLFVIVMLVSGCASFYCSRYPNDNYSPTVAENMPIYNNYPPTPYEIIGEVGGNGAPASSWSGMGKRMREYAARMGGDAIVIQSQATPYVGTYTTPTTINSTSSAYDYDNTNIQGSAHRSGNYVYGQANAQTYGQAYGQSHTTINPGSSIPMYGKSVRAFVIKFKTSSGQLMKDKKYGSILNNYLAYKSSDINLTKRGQVNLFKIYSSYKREQANPASLQKDLLENIKKAIAEYGNKNSYVAIYNDKMPNCHEEDVSDKIIILLNSQYK